MLQDTFLLYGATGYTGELIARAAVRQGLRPILAARNAAAVAALANELALPYRVFSLDDAALSEHIADVPVVLNCAGPFAYTAQKLAVACMQSGCHYLDIAGEVPEFQALFSLDEAARQAGVMLLPGVGFGIAPSDSLALHLKTRLPGASELSLAFDAQGGVSRGTLLNMLKDLPTAGVVRRNGELIPLRAGKETRRIDFGQGPRTAGINPWRGDIFTAYYSTGIPTIKAYTVFPSALQTLMSIGQPLNGLLRARAVQNLFKRLAQSQPAGPDEQARAQGRTILWGEAVDAQGQRVVSILNGPEAYDFTVLTALAIVARVLSGASQPGFHTPAQVYGVDLVLKIPGVTCHDA